MRGLAVLTAVLAVLLLTRTVPSPRRRRSPGVPGRVVAGAIGTGLAAGTMVWGLTDVATVAAAVAMLVGAAPPAAWRRRQTRRRAAVSEQLTDLVTRIRSRLAAGEALPEAFVTAATGMGGRLGEVGAQVRTARAVGTPFAVALAEAREELGEPLADRVMAMLAAAHHSGGGRVSQLLGVLATSVADELRLRKAHDAALTQQRLTALVALVAPWVLLILTVATNPAAAASYRTPGGLAVVIIGLSVTVLGYLLSRRAARLSRPPRVFR